MLDIATFSHRTTEDWFCVLIVIVFSERLERENDRLQREMRRMRREFKEARGRMARGDMSSSTSTSTTSSSSSSSRMAMSVSPVSSHPLMAMKDRMSSRVISGFDESKCVNARITNDGLTLEPSKECDGAMVTSGWSMMMLTAGKKHVWRLCIDELSRHKKKDSYVAIGIINVDYPLSKQWFMYISNGKKKKNNDKSCTKYGQICGKRDVIECVMDARTGTLSYQKNDEFLGIAFDEIDMKSCFRFFVELKYAKVSIISCK